MKFEDIAPYLKVDIKELLARRVVDTTINSIVFRYKNNDNLDSILWKDFVDELLEYNDLTKIHKTDTKYKSKWGKSIVGFDLWENHPIIWFADINNGEAVRINGMKQFAVSCTRTYATINNGTPILKNRLIITNKNIAYLFAGGFGVSPKQERKIKKFNKENEYKDLTAFIPYQWTTLSIPEYIKSHFRVGTYTHNYGVLPAMEMLNKDFIDNDSDFATIGELANDSIFADTYPAQPLIDLFNGFLQFFAAEMILDETRIIGTFSQQDINNLIGKNKNSGISLGEKPDLNRLLARGQELLGWSDEEKSVIKKRLILKSLGGEGSQLEKMQTTLKSLEFTQTLDQLLTLVFKASGYSWESSDGKVYENVSQTMNSSKGVYESTKEKIELFERQWIDFYSRIAFAWFKSKNKPFLNLDEARQEFVKNIEFKIVSNILQQENSNYQKVVELKMNSLISTYKAIKDLNPDMTEEELEKEVSRIKEDNKTFDSFDFDNFNNQDYLGYEEEKDNQFKKSYYGSKQ